jgi:N utilization substance protein B
MTSDRTSNLSGNEKRKRKSAARLYAVQALYQMEQTGQTFDQVRIEFLDHRFGEVFEDHEMIDGYVYLFKQLV